eukprot:SAG22_NODE_2916_length_2107_cov_1.378984_2_plen_336_part_00
MRRRSLSGGPDPVGLLRLTWTVHTGAQNPMPSESYDFFAPLGEFGQPRRHYHQMRRLHNMVKGWGALLAETTQTLPLVGPSGENDNRTVRWSVRTDNHSAGFLFVKCVPQRSYLITGGGERSHGQAGRQTVRQAGRQADTTTSSATDPLSLSLSLCVCVCVTSNYQRLLPLPAHTDVRFAIRGRDGSTITTVPSAKSPALTVEAGVWFALPLNIPLLPAFAAHGGGGGGGGDGDLATLGTTAPKIGWATAQLAARLDEEVAELSGAVLVSADDAAMAHPRVLRFRSHIYCLLTAVRYSLSCILIIQVLGGDLGARVDEATAELRLEQLQAAVRLE